MLEASSRDLLADYPALSVRAVAAEYEVGLEHLRAGGRSARPGLILWIGSSIGNFEPAEARRFLRAVRAALSPADRFLVGIDLRKDRAVLEAACDDPSGMTARFNLNLLAPAPAREGVHPHPDRRPHEPRSR